MERHAEFYDWDNMKATVLIIEDDHGRNAQEGLNNVDGRD